MGVPMSKREIALKEEDESARKDKFLVDCLMVQSESIDQFQRWLPCQGPQSAYQMQDSLRVVCPTPRSGHTVCLVGKIIYLFGGCGKALSSDDQCLNDLYAFDTDTLLWKKIEAKGDEKPSVRRSASMCTVNDHSFLLSGGAGDDPDHLRTDLYIFDVLERTWTKLLEGQDAMPFGLCGQSTCAWKDSIIFFGGSTGLEYSNELYQYNVTTNRWIQLATTGSRPTPRYKHQAIIRNNSMYVLGGGCFKPLCEDVDVYRLDLLELRWHHIPATGSLPMSRVAHSCALDDDEGAIYVYGGFTAGLQCLRNFYKLSLDTNRWTSIPSPPREVSPSARSFHGSVFHDGAVYVLSGSNGCEKFSDVWRFQVRQDPLPLLTLSAHALLSQSTCSRKMAKKVNGKLTCPTYIVQSAFTDMNGEKCRGTNVDFDANRKLSFEPNEVSLSHAKQPSASINMLPLELVQSLENVHLLAKFIV